MESMSDQPDPSAGFSDASTNEQLLSSILATLTSRHPSHSLSCLLALRLKMKFLQSYRTLRPILRVSPLEYVISQFLTSVDSNEPFLLRTSCLEDPRIFKRIFSRRIVFLNQQQERSSFKPSVVDPNPNSNANSTSNSNLCFDWIDYCFRFGSSELLHAIFDFFLERTPPPASASASECTSVSASASASASASGSGSESGSQPPTRGRGGHGRGGGGGGGRGGRIRIRRRVKGQSQMKKLTIGRKVIKRLFVSPCSVRLFGGSFAGLHPSLVSKWMYVVERGTKLRIRNVIEMVVEGSTTRNATQSAVQPPSDLELNLDRVEDLLEKAIERGNLYCIRICLVLFDVLKESLNWRALVKKCISCARADCLRYLLDLKGDVIRLRLPDEMNFLPQRQGQGQGQLQVRGDKDEDQDDVLRREGKVESGPAKGDVEEESGENGREVEGQGVKESDEESGKDGAGASASGTRAVRVVRARDVQVERGVGPLELLLMGLFRQIKGGKIPVEADAQQGGNEGENEEEGEEKTEVRGIDEKDPDHLKHERSALKECLLLLLHAAEYPPDAETFLRVDYDEFTALHYAIAHNHLETVQLLVEKGANLEKRTRKRTISLDGLQEEEVIDVSILEVSGCDGLAAGRYADEPNLSPVKRLSPTRKSVSDDDIIDPFRDTLKTALGLALYLNVDPSIVRFLIKSGARVNPERSRSVMQVEQPIWAAIRAAVRSESAPTTTEVSMDIVRCIVECQPDVDFVINSKGESIMHVLVADAVRAVLAGVENPISVRLIRYFCSFSGMRRKLRSMADADGKTSFDLLDSSSDSDSPIFEELRSFLLVPPIAEDPLPAIVSVDTFLDKTYSLSEVFMWRISKEDLLRVPRKGPARDLRKQHRAAGRRRSSAPDKQATSRRGRRGRRRMTETADIPGAVIKSPTFTVYTHQFLCKAVVSSGGDTFRFVLARKNPKHILGAPKWLTDFPPNFQWFLDYDVQVTLDDGQADGMTYLLRQQREVEALKKVGVGSRETYSLKRIRQHCKKMVLFKIAFFGMRIIPVIEKKANE